MKHTRILLSVTLCVALAVVAFVMLRADPKRSFEPELGQGNVYLEGDVQVVELFVRGGYSPELSVASSGVPTILRLRTEGSFDCSTSIVIPEINERRTLPFTGVTDIPLGTRTEGVLSGACSMDMYRFSVEFRP